MIHYENLTKRGAAISIRACALALGLTLPAAALAPALGQESVEQFYKGRKIDIVIGFSVGGGYDAYARLLSRHMGEHIPGKPGLIPRNMTGAGSRIAAGFVHSVAAKDGTVMGLVDQSMPLEQALDPAAMKFDSREFNWIGNVVADNNIVANWHTSPVKTIEDAKKIEATMGATGYNTSSQYPTVLNQMIGTKFKVIMGYPGGAEVNLAMERGEVQGRGSNSWASYKGTKGDWVRDGKVIILAQVGLKRAVDLPNAPLLQELATNEEDRAAMRLLSAPTAIGRPFFVPPGVPADRVKALRAAFDATMIDKKFLEEASRLNLDVNPVSGEELQKIVADIIDAPEAAKKRLSSVLALVEREKAK
jgi:tripartite-type tricarboxylate transporter receptor subunit TctC